MYGNKIRKFREEKNLSQEFIAEKTGMPQTSISTWERSEFPPNPPLYIFLKALNFLKIPYIEFFSNPDDLKNYIPSFLDGNDLKIAEMITGLNEKTRMEYKELCLRMARLLIDRSKDI